jgi:hypothetical protein
VLLLDRDTLEIRAAIEFPSQVSGLAVRGDELVCLVPDANAVVAVPLS